MKHLARSLEFYTLMEARKVNKTVEKVKFDGIIAWVE